MAFVKGGMRGEAVTQVRAVGATYSGETANFYLLGAGWFRALEIEKESGNIDRTSVTIERDGIEMITTSIFHPQECLESACSRFRDCALRFCH